MSAPEFEVLDNTTGELVPYTAQPPATLFRSEDPAEILVHATALADTLEPVIRKRKLFKKIGDKDHVFVEAWTLCGTMLGVFPVCDWTRPLDNGWEARVEARTRDGAVIGAAEAQCTRSESTWKNREDYALRSMAQTRATSKAMRGVLGFIIHLAGFSTTPAEEMPTVEHRAPNVEDDGLFPPVNPETGEIILPGTDPVISDAQRRRLRAIQNRCGVSDDELKTLVADICGVDSSKLIPLRTYDLLIGEVEARAMPAQEAFTIPEGAQ